MDSNLIVILNDNDMSIAPPVGAMSAYLSEMISSRPYQSIRDLVNRSPAGFRRNRKDRQTGKGFGP